MVNVVYMIYGFFFWGLLSTAGLIICLRFTPALQFLVSRFAKTKAVMLLIHKGNRISFTTANYNAGCFHTKKFGLFDESANSAYYAYRTPLYFAPEYYSHTLPAEFPMQIQAAKGEGFEFLNLDQFLDTAKKNPTKELKLANGQTIRMGDLQHMFPAIDDPHVREKEKASEVLISKGLSGGQDLKKWLILLLIGGIVAFIIWKLFLTGKAQQAVTVTCEYPDIVNAGAQVVSNLTL